MPVQSLSFLVDETASAQSAMTKTGFCLSQRKRDHQVAEIFTQEIVGWRVTHFTSCCWVTLPCWITG
jgi:hypothetical protein